MVRRDDVRARRRDVFGSLDREIEGAREQRSHGMAKEAAEQRVGDGDWRSEDVRVQSGRARHFGVL